MLSRGGGCGGSLALPNCAPSPPPVGEVGGVSKTGDGEEGVGGLFFGGGAGGARLGGGGGATVAGVVAEYYPKMSWQHRQRAPSDIVSSPQVVPASRASDLRPLRVSHKGPQHASLRSWQAGLAASSWVGGADTRVTRVGGNPQGCPFLLGRQFSLPSTSGDSLRAPPVSPSAEALGERSPVEV